MSDASIKIDDALSNRGKTDVSATSESDNGDCGNRVDCDPVCAGEHGDDPGASGDCADAGNRVRGAIPAQHADQAVILAITWRYAICAREAQAACRETEVGVGEKQHA